MRISRYTDEHGRIQEIDSLFNTFIARATEEISQRVDWLVSVFHDNAGVIRLNEDWNVSMKVETHNTPSALDPYGGALTGIVGVNRDPFGTGKGCQLLFNTDVFCFAPPDYAKPLPPRLMHPKRIFRGVHRGVKDGANQSGIPDVNGAILFDERFLGKPLVFCGTGGIMPAMLHGQPAHEKRANPGDLIVMVGGRIGKDGIHGATFSSQELREDSPVSAVQIGDPITQKKMFDFLLEARDQGLVPRDHRQRGGRVVLLGGRDGSRQPRLRTPSGKGPAEICRPATLGNPLIRGAGAHDAGRATQTHRRLPGFGGPTRGGSHRPGAFHRQRRIPCALQRPDRGLSGHGLPA